MTVSVRGAADIGGPGVPSRGRGGRRIHAFYLRRSPSMTLALVISAHGSITQRPGLHPAGFYSPFPFSRLPGPVTTPPLFVLTTTLSS